MADKKCKCDEGGGEGAPAWMSTFADMMTLILCFFVLLFAFSNIASDKFMKLIASFQGAFGLFGGTSVAPPGAGAFAKRRKAETRRDYGRMMEEDIKNPEDKKRVKKKRPNVVGIVTEEEPDIKQEIIKKLAFFKYKKKGQRGESSSRSKIEEVLKFRAQVGEGGHQGEVQTESELKWLASVQKMEQHEEFEVRRVKREREEMQVSEGEEGVAREHKQIVLTESEYEKLKKAAAEREKLKKKLEEMLKNEGLKVPKDVEVKIVKYKEGEQKGILIRFKNRVLFDSGSATLKPMAKKILKAVAQAIEKLPCTIRVEGHTDNVPISPRLRKKYPTNWELSVARATSVLRYMLSVSKIDPRRMSAAGYGKWHPIASNDTPEGRAKNRRVDIYLIFGKNVPGVSVNTEKKSKVKNSKLKHKVSPPKKE